MPSEKSPEGFKKNTSGKRLSSIIMNDYLTLHKKASEGAFVVWIAIIVPAEIFSGFDNVVYAVPESHAALCAGKGVGPLLCEKAEQLGYSTDLCSYARIDLGTAFGGAESSPTFGLPKPDLIISNNNNCSLLVKWFDVYHRAWGVPHVLLDIPFCYENQSRADFEYIMAQFGGLIRTIEDLSGQKFDINKARESVKLSSRALKEWKRFLSFATHRPSGITAFDSFVQMAPILTSRGTEKLAEHYRLLADETEEQVKNGIFPVPGERYRLLWDNIAPWHQLRKMSSRLASLDANITSASYTYCIGALEGEYEPYEFDGKDPLQWLARLQNFSVCPHGLNLRGRAMKEVIGRNAIDGVVFASNRSCKVYSLMQMDQMRHMKEELGIPCIMIDVDHADVRKYSEETTFTRLEALIEMIDKKRSGAPA
ncbi:MAG TPA: 2-hydroxyacyl-CoA dehydratase family protein [Deltaproteobacteria bacterium]|jgi:benzoyl-CoA reductase/2-hydroxyglutaryl-CoA dehydratase subunit BcrC/BadD/HgdB|nr:2-hydroxyacyl-CoA dehydratase family protein [Deltaproteobacteria bacterium]